MVRVRRRECHDDGGRGHVRKRKDQSYWRVVGYIINWNELKIWRVCLSARGGARFVSEALAVSHSQITVPAARAHARDAGDVLNTHYTEEHTRTQREGCGKVHPGRGEYI